MKKQLPEVQNERPSMPNTSIDLLDEIWNKVQPVKREDFLIASIMRMVAIAFSVSACSLLLLDETKQELYFKFADGPVRQKLKRLHVKRQSGIAGWIVRNGKPLVVNDPERSKEFYKLIDEATGFETKSIMGAPISVDGKIIGVIEALNKRNGASFSRQNLEVLTELAASAAMALDNVRKNTELINSYRSTVKALVSLADMKETSGGGHSRRVCEYSLMGASQLSLPNDEKHVIEYAAILHDIGKLSIPDSVLNKTEALTPEEWKMIQKHPVIGSNLLKEIPFLKEASTLILCHHERFDGQGYTQGLKGEAIPLGARLISVADAFDQMTTPHVYRKAISRPQAFIELRKQIGKQFCPIALRAFNSGYIRSRLFSE